MSGRRKGQPVLVEELTSKEFAARVRKDPLVIVPVGSLEEHGSHLPLGTDSMQAEEVARRVALELDALVCPPLRYGDCRSTRNFPGTISLSFETVQLFAFDVVSELARNGVRKIMVLTGHAGSGHMAALRLGTMRAVDEYPDIRVMVLSDYDIAYELKGKEFPETDGHGGLIETSRVLGIRPELVGPDRPSGRNTAPKYMVLPDPEAYFKAGISGDTKDASAARGKRIDDFVVEELCRLAAENFGIKRKSAGRPKRRP